MGSKEEYEARRAERKIRRDAAPTQSDRDIEDMMEMIDRFVTAVERIADAMEASKPPLGFKLDAPDPRE
jgi:hypothetical protein